MNRTELEALVAEKTGVGRKDVANVISETFAAIEGALKGGDEVRLVGFGTFGVKDVAAKEGRNPRTGEKMQIDATKKPYFKAGKGLNEAVKG